MRALVQTGNGGVEVLEVEERPDPEVGPTQIRIAVRASGLNFADTMARVGLYPDAPKPPAVLGYEVAGEVESVGVEVADFAVGDRVMAGTRFGGHASMVSINSDQALPLPDSFGFEQGAAFPVNYGTAYAALVVMGGLKPGERVLIHAAAGGVGIAATQIARNIGAEIFGTSSASKHDAIRAQGVDHAIDYRSMDFEKEINRITDGVGVDLVMDAIGPSSFRKDYRLLRPGGRLVMFGLSEATTDGRRDLVSAVKSLVKMPLATMPWWKSLQMISENKGVFGLNMLSWWDREKSLGRLTEPLMEDLNAGRLVPVIAGTFPFEQAGEAHKMIAERRNIGKVVLTPG